MFLLVVSKLHPDCCTRRPPKIGGQVRSLEPASNNTYQLDFTTPGISPLRASDRKQRRHTPNLRRNARGRPQIWQRLCWRDLNFGTRASLTRFAVVAITLFPFYLKLLEFAELLRALQLDYGMSLSIRTADGLMLCGTASRTPSAASVLHDRPSQSSQSSRSCPSAYPPSRNRSPRR